jgi:RNA polymerase sigma-70 factor (ECF subfamily)
VIATLSSKELDQHTRYLTAYALRKVSDRATAEDLVQDTLLAALSSDAPFEGRSSERTWLTGILKHKIIDHFRARAHAPVSIEALADGSDEPNEPAIAAQSEQFDFGGDPQKQLEHKRFWEAFKRELGRMPARTAQAFVLSEFTDTPTEEVCDQLGMSTGALWVTRCRTRDALRRSLLPAMAA